MSKRIPYKDTMAMPGSNLHTILNEKKEDWEKKAKQAYDSSTEMDIRLTGKEGIAKIKEIQQSFKKVKNEQQG